MKTKMEYVIKHPDGTFYSGDTLGENVRWGRQVDATTFQYVTQANLCALRLRVYKLAQVLDRSALPES